MKIRHIAAAVTAIAMLTSCTSRQAGAAVIIDGTATSAATVGDRVNAVRAEIESLPAGSVSSVPAVVDLNAMIVNQILLDAVLSKAVAKNGVSVTDADVANFRDSVFKQYGKDAIVVQLATQNGVSTAALDGFMRAVLLERKLGMALDPAGTSDSQTSALVKELTAVSGTMGITVSPRFGQWNPNKLQLDAGDNILSLAATAKVTD